MIISYAVTHRIRGLILSLMLGGIALLAASACSDSSNDPNAPFNGTWEATYQIETGLIQTSLWTLYESGGSVSGTVRLRRGQWYTESQVTGTLNRNGALALNFVGNDSLSTTTVSSVVTTTHDYMSGIIVFLDTDPISGKNTLTSWGFEAIKQ